MFKLILIDNTHVLLMVTLFEIRRFIDEMVNQSFKNSTIVELTGIILSSGFHLLKHSSLSSKNQPILRILIFQGLKASICIFSEHIPSCSFF